MNTASLLPRNFELDSPHDPLLQATIDLERVAKFLDLEDWIVERLRHCEQETVVNFLLTGDDGQSHPVTGICVRHSTANGPAALYFDISREAYRNSVCAEAMRMSWLSALYGVHYGGGAMAVVLDSQKQSEPELQRAVRQFGSSASDVLSSAGLILPHKAHQIEMDWLEAGIEKHEPSTRSLVVGNASSPNSKTLLPELVAGVAELIRCAAGNLKQRIAVQGFDSQVQALLVHLHKHGARIVATADESGGLLHDLGLDPEQLVEHVRRHGVLLGYPEASAALNADVIESDCDLLILAGGEQQITSQNVSKIRARVVLEIAPGAVTPSAGQELAADGKVLLDSLLCAGPVLLRAVAQARDLAPANRRIAWIRRAMRSTWKDISDAAGCWNVSPSEAAHGVGIQRVAAILRAQRTPL